MSLLAVALGAFGRGNASAGEDPAADRDLIRQIAARDSSAMAALYDRHSRTVFSLVLRIVEDRAEAEEVVQDVFAQAWRQADRYDAKRGAVAAWLITIARSRAIDLIRSRRARPDAVQAPDEQIMLRLPDVAEPTDIVLASAERAAQVRKALRQLPFLQRSAIELAFFEGLSHTEIAERLEQPLGTVKTRIRLGLLKLREALAGSGT
jgi:RNA polymerase sigma-70 factor (ECF subfamily)